MPPRSSDPAALLARIAAMEFPGHSAAAPLRLMEVCGTHTMAIAKAGLRRLLPPTVRLISGPGCPVCVTPAGAIDEVLRIALLPGVTIATYGDLLRVPGSRPGDTLAARRAMGAQVRVVYSAMDALALARQEPGRQIVFLGVGFETTAPGTAACIAAAKAEGTANFSVLSLLKYTVPALRALLADPSCRIDGFLCPGHVATVLGAEAFRFLPAQYGAPAVVAGFENADLLLAVYDLCAMLAAGTPALKNDYRRAVRDAGNPAARAMLAEVFAPKDDVWRGLGPIPQSGMTIRPQYAAHDAALRFGFAPQNRESRSPCRCGQVLKGALEPAGCPLFGKTCTPADPVGPCMVSGEGACAAAYKYCGVEPPPRSHP